MRTICVAVLTMLIAPASAFAGGFATVGLSSTPAGTAPGDDWVVELTILQHGRSEAPLDGLRPTLIVTGSEGERRRFTAAPTGRPGVYRARVTFPSAGVWRYSVNDGFAGVIHSYPPVQIGARSAAAGLGGGTNLGLALLVAGVAGLGLGLITRMLRPLRGPGPPAEA